MINRPTLLAIGLLWLGALRAEPVDVLVTAARDAELSPLIARLQSPHPESHAAWQCWTGTLFGKKVALTRTEGDPLNAVAATTLAIRRYEPRLVVTFGSARAHDPALRPGDVVVSEQFAAFDGLFSHVKPLGGGCDPSQWERLPHLLITAGEKENPTFTFPASQPALALAKTLNFGPGRLVPGTLGSAGQQNAEADRVAWLHAQWGTACEDGESAHIAGCAQLLGVPVIGLRVIQAPGAAGTIDPAASAVVLKFLEALP